MSVHGIIACARRQCWGDVDNLYYEKELNIIAGVVVRFKK